MESAAESTPGAVPWRCLIIEHDGRRRVAFRWSRPSASASDIADEVMAVVAHQIHKKHRKDPKMVAHLLAGCVVQVTRPEHHGWPAQYGESHGVTWLEDAEAPAPGREDRAA